MRMLVRFGKNARLRFISHLDLQRFLHMALNRTGLPIQYSQGFNPHPVMAFGSALALGWTSEYEILDVKLSAPMGRRRCEEAIRFALPEELPVGHGGAALVDGKQMGVYRASETEYYAVELRCPHLGCRLEWNPDEKSWDCPCHGSRFDFRGNRLSAPAQTSLQSCKLPPRPETQA